MWSSGPPLSKTSRPMVTKWPGTSVPPNFDTTGVKIFSHKGWLLPLWNSEYVKATSNPVGGNFWPTGPQVEYEIRAQWAQSENISFGMFSFGPSRCLPIGKQNKIKKVSDQGWISPLLNSEYLRGKNFLGQRLKNRLLQCLPLEGKFLFKSAQVFGASDAYHLRGSSRLYLDNWIVTSDIGSISGAAPWTDIYK